MAAPTVMTPEVLAKLEIAYSNNATDIQACFLAGIAPATLYNYQKEHPEFTERKKALKSNLGLIAKGVIADAIRSGDVAKSAWYLERVEKAEFGQHAAPDVDINLKLPDISIKIIDPQLPQPAENELIVDKQVDGA